MNSDKHNAHSPWVSGWPPELPDSKEMSAMDQQTIDAGIKSIDLMEKAGIACADKIEEIIGDSSDQICILCGPGNNGGDGLVIARELQKKDRKLCVVLTKSDNYSEQNLENQKRLNEMGIPLIVFDHDTAELRRAFEKCSVAVDSLLGTGQTSSPRGTIEVLIKEVENFDGFKSKIAIDLPTGINPDSGAMYSPCFTATHSLAIQCVKRGMVQFPAWAACGKILTLDIDIKALPTEVSVLDSNHLRALPKRALESNKGDFGRVLLASGSRQMPGAACLAGLGALKTGAGRVIIPHFEGGPPVSFPSEFIFFPVVGRETLDDTDVDTLLNQKGRGSVIVSGPGLGRTDEAIRTVERILEVLSNSEIEAAIIDADGLWCLSQLESKIDTDWSERIVLTPHPGEAARLLDTTIGEIESDRYGSARELYNRYRSVVVLKGASTVIWNSLGGYAHPRPNPFLATPGSGDVLSGVIGSLCAQGVPAREAAGLGVYLHAEAAWRATCGATRPCTASAVADQLSFAYQALALRTR